MRNVELTKQRILDAATTEFSAHGYSGARVDRIATNASANKALIYTYFGNKEQLFEAVLDQIMAQVLRDVRFDPVDLPGYLERRLDWFFHNPALARIAVWTELDPDSLPGLFASADVRQRKIDALVVSQRSGQVSSRFTASQILDLIDVLARPALVLRGEATVPLAEFEDYKQTAGAALRLLTSLHQEP